MQGGFLTAMLDDTMGPAVGTTFGPGEFCTTLELKVSLLRPAKPGRFRVTAWVVHRGGSIAFVQSELRDGDGELVAAATSTVRLIRPQADAYWSADATRDKSH